MRKAIAFSSRRWAASESSRLLGDRSYIPVYILSINSNSGMSRVNDKVSRGLEVPLRALWCKVRGGERKLAPLRRRVLYHCIYITNNFCAFFRHMLPLLFKARSS